MKPAQESAPFLITISILAALLVHPASVLLLQASPTGFVSVRPTTEVQPEPEIAVGDFDRDGEEEWFSLQQHMLTLLEGERIIWQSPPEWQVLQVQITDLNRDHIPELSLLIWRPHKPWPIDAYIAVPGRIDAFHDKRHRSCHIIMIGWRDGTYREIWAGSALSQPIVAFQALDLDLDSQQELVTLDGRYDNPRQYAHALSIWTWNGFGFSLQARQQIRSNGNARVFELNQIPGLMLQGKMEGDT